MNCPNCGCGTSEYFFGYDLGNLYKCESCGHGWRDGPPGPGDYQPPGPGDHQPRIWFLPPPGSCPVCNEPDLCKSGVLTDDWRWVWFGCTNCGHGDPEQPEWQYFARKIKGWQVVA